MKANSHGVKPFFGAQRMRAIVTLNYN
jgi:hypothetical protein